MRLAGGSIGLDAAGAQKRGLKHDRRASARLRAVLARARPRYLLRPHGDPSHFRLGIEAHRLGPAYEYDNPWQERDQLITSLSWVRGDESRREAGRRTIMTPWRLK